MEALVQRLTGFASAAIPLDARVGNLADDPERTAGRMPAAVRWALWVCLVILPGSFLLLPVLLWGRRIRSLLLRSRARTGRTAQPMRSGSTAKPLAG